MTCSERVSQWTETVSSQLPHLSRPQASVLALWSLGMVLTQSCGLSQVSAGLSLVLGQAEGTLRQRLREWYYPAKDKAGQQRCTLEVASCFAPLLRSRGSMVARGVAGTGPGLGCDQRSRQRFTVLCVSVLVCGCAIPVAWKVLAYNQKGAWQPYWQALLAQLDGVIPADWTVLVLADRGLYAPWLYRQIVAQGWHAFLRINVGAKVCLQGSDRWEWIAHWVPPLGQQWAQRVHCFADKPNRLECTLLICREPGYEEPWVIVTDLPAEQVQGTWYRLRAWIEGGFKDFKRGQWGWHHTKMLDPQRAERLWLALAVTTLWVVGVGSQAEVSRPAAQLEQLPPQHVARRTAGSGKQGPRGRELSCVTRGRLCLLAAVWLGEAWPQAALWPQAWPEHFPAARPLPAATQQKRQKQRERQRVKRRKRKAAHRKGKGKGKKAA